MIRLIVSDVDGTLVPEGAPFMDERVIGLIRALKEKGIAFAVASGRQTKSVENLFEPVRDGIYFITNNGAYMGYRGECLFAHTIPGELVGRAIAAGRRREGLGMLLSCERQDWAQEGNEEMYRLLKEGYHFDVRKSADLATVDSPVFKISFYKNEHIEEAAAGIMEEFKNEAKISCSGSKWVDFMAMGVNKGLAVRELQKILGVTPKETMVFGDQLNDIEMLAGAYYSFAVSDARREVRDAARFTADGCVNGGVCKVLECLL